MFAPKQLKMEENKISKERQLQKQLNEHPSCFQTFDKVKQIKKKKIKAILAKVKSERDEVGHRGSRENERDLNVLSYLSFAVEKYDDARQYNREVLKNNEHSISAIVSKAWYHLHNSEFGKTQEQCSRLETLKTNKLEILYAKAEHAYVCSRLGMQFYMEAERLFKEILADVGETNIPDYEICLWKFGLAQIIKRQLNLFNVNSENLGNLNCEKERRNQSLKLFRDVLLLSCENIDTHKARAYVEIGDLLNVCITKKQTDSINKEILDSFCPNVNFSRQVRFCYKKSSELCGDDVYVLVKAGKYFRLIGQISKSINMLKHAVQIRETTAAHHHLALALKKELEEGTNTKRSKPQHEKPIKSGMHTAWQSKLIKCPPKPIALPPDKIGDILFHLERSFDLGENFSALYDKGLVLRAAEKYHDALDVFRQMIRNKNFSLVTLSNAYEQSAFCLQDLLENNRTDVSRDEESIDLDMKEYLLKAIEIQCAIIARQPSLKNCWTAFPTYKKMLEVKPYSISKTWALGRLHKMVQDYNEAITCFKQVLENETDDRGRASVLVDITQTCIDAGDYSEAIVHLDMLLCLPECGTVDEILYFKAHIEGGLQACSEGEMEIARLRMKNALDYRRRIIEDSNIHGDVDVHEQDESSQGEKFDVLVLSDHLASDTTGRVVNCLLTNLGLDTTLNDNNAAANLPCSDGLSKVIEISTHCIIILGENIENMDSIKYYANIVKHTYDTRHYGNIVVVKENNTVSVDTMFTGFTTMLYEQIESYTADHKPWIKDLLWRLASGAAYDQT